MSKQLLFSLMIGAATITNTTAKLPGFGKLKDKDGVAIAKTQGGDDANQPTVNAQATETSATGEQLHHQLPKEVVHDGGDLQNEQHQERLQKEGNVTVIKNIDDKLAPGTDAKILETRANKPNPAVFSTKQKEQLKQLISDHIKSNPEIIETAIEVLEQKREAEQAKQISEQQKKIQQHVDKNREMLLDTNTSSIYGNKQGYKIMVVFYDDNCPYCRNFGKMLPEFIKADGDLKIIMRPWAFLSNASKEVAAVLLAADKQDKFGVLYQKVADHSGKLGQTGALELAEEAGLNVEQIKKDLQANDNFAATIRKNSELARDSGFVGTPTILLGNAKKLELVDLGTFTPDKFKDSISKITSTTVETKKTASQVNEASKKSSG